MKQPCRAGGVGPDLREVRLTVSRPHAQIAACYGRAAVNDLKTSISHRPAALARLLSIIGEIDS